MLAGEVVHQLQHDRSVMPNQRRSALEEFQPESCNRVALMHGLATVSFEALEQIVGEQLDQQVQLSGFKISCGDTVDGEAVLGLLDIVFHTAALIVEAPQIDRLSFQDVAL